VPVAEALWLVKNGVPFDLAFQLSDIDRTAWAIIFSEQGGGVRFNFDTLSFDRVDE
jgi:hypothetical protein